VEAVTLPADASTPGTARRMVREALADVDPAAAATVLLMVTELVTNVVRHAKTEVVVSIDVGPPIRVEVHDGVAATDAFREMIRTRPRSADPHAPGGRGLALVHDMASRIGIADDPRAGKVVWFELDLT
jgi:anti-sigma regulatory factor (Ser/Thr protein kinase)